MPTLIADCAVAYEGAEPATPTPRELQCLTDWISEQWGKLPFAVDFTDEPIPSLGVAMAGLRETGRLTVSTVGNCHPFLGAESNLRFRAIHDWHHWIGGVDDSFAGECAAYSIATASAPMAIHWILFSEIVLQAASAIYRGVYPVQKLVRL